MSSSQYCDKVTEQPRWTKYNFTSHPRPDLLSAPKKSNKADWPNSSLPEKPTVAELTQGEQFESHDHENIPDTDIGIAEYVDSDITCDIDSGDEQLGPHTTGKTPQDAIEIADDTDSDIDSSDESDAELGPSREAGRRASDSGVNSPCCAFGSGSDEGNLGPLARTYPASREQAVSPALDNASPERVPLSMGPVPSRDTTEACATGTAEAT
ncbi:hypothetical protein F53441_1896 [Fusarium austroafricanum]|uniref:Uncharacterized protein n=1 Tax=Fusarium austroafricanum TaxID=2364996 RepID=A0A8H4NYF8_9HYPO|nr:hypothetical protein F53441_1896 [Fusarium austroafricanum]